MAEHDTGPEPLGHWQLSAPESIVLLWGPETGDTWPIKLGLLELVARRIYRLESFEKRLFLFRKKTVNVLIPTGHVEPDLPWPLQAIVDIFPSSGFAGNAPGPTIQAVIRAVYARRYGGAPKGLLQRRTAQGGYVVGDVLPALQARGLFTQRHEKRLGILDRVEWSLTAEGARASTILRQMIDEGRTQFPGWAQNEPDRAAAFLRQIGPAILLVGGLAPSFRLLSQRVSSGVSSSQPDHAADAFTPSALAGVFGPGPHDDLDAAFSALSQDVDRAWEQASRSGHSGTSGE